MSPALLPTLMPTAFRPDLQVLVSRWTQQPPAAQLRPAYDELTAVALDHGARYWLQDIRHRDFNDPDITRWLLETYFADVARRLGGRLHVAYLASPTLLHLILDAPDFAGPATYDGQPFGVAFFSDEGAAFEWLGQQRAGESPSPGNPIP